MKTEKKQNNLDNLRHSAAHLLAAAVRELYPHAQNAIGPSIENGFYQDFDLGEVKVTEEDFSKIEEKMHEIVQSWGPFVEKEVTPEQALKDFAWNPYKVELIHEFAKDGKKITENDPGNFLDLCKGGHLKDPKKELKHFKLLSVAGAYWRGDEKNKMLTRIYGTIFPTLEELDAYLFQQEEAKKRDHKKLGKELDLFFIDEEVGQGLPIWTPKGTTVKHELEQFTWNIENKYGYQHVSTPYLGSEKLYQTSGHLSHYKENMYAPIDMDGEIFYLRPMSCPHHIKIFAHKQRSYRELPVRYAEICDYNRYEKSGELMGMIRVRKFQLTDSHIFVSPEGLKDEFKNVCKLIDEAMTVLGIKEKVSYRFSKRDPENKEKYYPDDKLWITAEATMKEALDELKLDYVEAEDEAAFYGPKLDVQFKNVNGKEDTIITAQMDFLLPEKFDLSYIDEKGEKKRPVMIHRSVIGALERTFAYLIEHYAGAFPVWLAPVQVKILPITDAQFHYCRDLSDQLIKLGVRVEIDERSEKLGAKIRDAQMEKVPYMVIVGAKEVEAKKVSVRLRTEIDLGQLDVSEFIDRITKKIEKKSLNL